MRGGDLLARHLWRRRATTASVVELGSGLGLVALAAPTAPASRRSSSRRTATTAPWRNSEECGREVAVERLRWGDAEDLDRVLAHANVRASPGPRRRRRLHGGARGALARTCRALLAPGGDVDYRLHAAPRRRRRRARGLRGRGLVMRRGRFVDDERKRAIGSVFFIGGAAVVRVVGGGRGGALGLRCRASGRITSVRTATRSSRTRRAASHQY